MKKFFKNVWYFIRCWFVKNPNNPSAPTLWNLKRGTKFEVRLRNDPPSLFIVKRVFWKISENGDLKFMATVKGDFQENKDIFLSDQGIVPYLNGWHKSRVPYFVD